MIRKMESDNIRYRVWDGKKMRYPPDETYPFFPFFLGMNGSVWDIFSVKGDGTTGIRQTDLIAMLSTGMTDKNGREVWAGDIVSFNPDGEVLQGEVQFDNGKFYLWTPEEWTYAIDEVVSGEVIGNVHESR